MITILLGLLCSFIGFALLLIGLAVVVLRVIFAAGKGITKAASASVPLVGAAAVTGVVGGLAYNSGKKTKNDN